MRDLVDRPLLCGALAFAAGIAMAHSLGGTALLVSCVVVVVGSLMWARAGRGGAALAAVTAGSDTPVPSWAGSLLVCGVVFFYVTYGGMRSTAWVNTFQTAVFMIVGVVAMADSEEVSIKENTVLYINWKSPIKDRGTDNPFGRIETVSRYTGRFPCR